MDKAFSSSRPGAAGPWYRGGPVSMRPESAWPAVVIALLLMGVGTAAAQERTLVEADLFVEDHQWSALSNLEDDMPGEGPGVDIELSAQLGGSASAGTGGPLLRASIDVDVVAAIIADRARQVGLRAVARAIRAAAGPGADRRYVAHLLEAAEQLLIDGGRLQRAHVERLVRVVVRMVLAEVFVRTRFPDAHLLNRSDYWERRLCGPGRGHRRPSAESLAYCRRLRMGMPQEDVSAVLVHLYLLDLAYWRLGATGLFEDLETEPPPCPFAFGRPGNTLCQVLVSGESDAERDARVDWVLNLDRVLDGILVARALAPLWRPDSPGARGLLRALLRSDDIGTFGETLGLRVTDWQSVSRLLGRVSRLEALSRSYVGYRVALADLDDGDVTREDLRVARARYAEICDLLEAEDGVCTGPQDSRPTVCAAEGLSAWATQEETADGETEEKPPEMPQQVRLGFDLLVTGMGDAGRVLASAALDEPPSLEALRARLDRQTRQLEERLWGGAGYLGVGLRISTLGLTEMGGLVRAEHELAATVDVSYAVLRAVPPSVWTWQMTEDGRNATATHLTLRATDRLLRLLHSLNLHTARETGLATVGSAIRGLESLGVRLDENRVAVHVLDAVEPVIDHLVAGRRADAGVLFKLAARVQERDVLAALGFHRRVIEACSQGQEDGLACWTLRIVQSLKEATRVTAEGVQMDGGLLRDTLASLGDDYRARSEWRWYFHLTIGLGQLATFTEAPGEPAGEVNNLRLSPLVAEQIGVGLASPAFLSDTFTFRGGLFASGLLYRAVLDSAESNAFFFGAFAAVDIFELLEVFMAPTLLFFAGEGGESVALRGGVSFGVQVPLGDYLSAL